MELQVIFLILLTHFVGDFVFQSDWQAQNKSTHNLPLIAHIITYSLVWFIVLIPTHSFIFTSAFTIITFGAHFATDWITSRCTKYFREKGDYHNFFKIVGFDQVLHYTQLIFTYLFLIKHL